MADNDNGGAPEAQNPVQNPAQAEATPVQVGILAQYVKDLSFENPNAPASLQKLAQSKPAIDVAVNVNARQVGEDVFEVDLKINASAKHDQESAFIVELMYSGLFGAKNLPQEALQPFLLIECPRLLFPFARRVIADATRDGGFPPLLLEPIDFAGLYRQHLEQQQNASQDAGQTVN